jgi:arginine exporter protein ArgO
LPVPVVVTVQPQTVARAVWATQLPATKQTARPVLHLLLPVLLVTVANPAAYLVPVVVPGAALQLLT